MEILNAQQYRNITQNVAINKRKYSEETKDLSEAIRQAVEKGNFLAVVPLVLTDTIANEFRADGFVVVVKMDSTEIIW